MELGEKDLALAVDMGRALRQPTPAASMVREFMAMALAGGYRGKDFVALLQMFREFSDRGKMTPACRRVHAPTPSSRPHERGWLPLAAAHSLTARRKAGLRLH